MFSGNLWLFFQERKSAPIKIKSALPPQKTQNTPPLKGGLLWTWVSPAERTHFCQAPITLAQPFPAPELRTEILRTRGFFWIFQERKIGPKRKFLGRICRGHPGVIRADILAQNFGQGTQNSGKTSIWARTSMTRRRGRPRPQVTSKNFGQKNFGLNFVPYFGIVSQYSSPGNSFPELQNKFWIF